MLDPRCESFFKQRVRGVREDRWSHHLARFSHADSIDGIAATPWPGPITCATWRNL